MRLGDSELRADCLGMRDRSWYVRADARSMRAGHAYAAVDEGEHFLVLSRPAEKDDEDYAVTGGYLERDGRHSPVVSGVRRTVGRRRGPPNPIEVHATDERGREITASGTVTASLASTSTPGMFTWM